MSARLTDTLRTRFSGRVSLRYIAGRVLWGVPVMIAVIAVSFVVMRFTPGGPFDREKPLPDNILVNLRAQYRLDRPMLPVYLTSDDPIVQREHDAFEADHAVANLGDVRVVYGPTGIAETQLFSYFGQIARGDFGVSMKFTDVSVNDILRRTFPVSFTLGLLAFAFAFLIGITLGSLAAWKRGTWVDGAAMVFATFGFSMPNFVLGALFIVVFALWIGILPPALWEGPAYMVLPVVTLALGPAAYIARLTRSGLLESLDQDYVRTARAKGVRESAVLFRHALANALGPLITVAGPLLAMLVTGSFIVELIFAIPGMGRYFITAVIDRDYPLVMGVTVVYAGLIVVANIVVDILYAVADPRVKLWSRPQTYWARTWWKLRRNRVAMAGLGIVAAITLLAVLAPLIAPHPEEFQDPDALLQGISLAHPMGTDRLGRDLFSRVLYGARISMSVALVTSFIAMILGTILGAFSGFVGGRTDNVLMRFVDVMYSFPDLLLIIIISVVIGQGVTGIILSLSLVSWITVARVVRGEVLAIKQRPFVEAARALGFGPGRILVREILPHAVAPIIITLTFRIPSVILAESTLSFIGLDLQPPASSWGVLASDGWTAITFYPHLIFFPALAIFTTILAFNLLGDGLRDAMDVRI